MRRKIRSRTKSGNRKINRMNAKQVREALDKVRQHMGDPKLSHYGRLLLAREAALSV